ncbi:TetR/AcrR family transcriptional regulator [Mycobacterium sp. 236(2023)]|uniref:TetR/AcrR family transcriptional regulator n=1 Tax=Mycobacterium sp. 236(2023) TaxID=3038163 RepID=UPI0024153222|nr:TetR/AcrR family transcriptional regulator [Mycobacterium sp. 236(2023)]MDG4664451.1 TetR/AcrR family transcriptional regulator [Mycobacterium sp. 236(2023)]
MATQMRSRPQQQRAREMRRRLLDSALRIVSRHGVATLTTQAIADTAHVSIGTVYRYFPDRAAILAELVDEAARDISFELVRGVGKALDLDVDTASLAVVDTLTTAYEKHAPVLQAALTSSSFDVPPYLNHAAMDEIERSLLPLGSAIPGRARPDLSPAELHDLVFLTMGVTSSACLRIALQRPPDSDRDAMVALTARMLAAALTPP